MIPLKEKITIEMKRTILISIIGIFITTGLYAQKAYKDGNNRIILDMSVAAGMPEGAVTTTPKTWNGIPSPSTALPGNLNNGPINEKVYHKLEIASSDANKVGEPDTFSMTWIHTFDACDNYIENGKGWRLPTQRELMMMWIFKDALVNLGVGLSSIGNTYWCATESGTMYSWYVNFSTGGTSGGRKSTDIYTVRCVREL